MDKAKQLVVALLCEFEPNHEIYRDLLGKAFVGEELAAGIRITKADLLDMRAGGKSIFEYPQVLGHFDRLALAIAAHGEEFTAHDLTRNIAGQRSILEAAERNGTLDKLFSPAVWLGRDAEMQSAWFQTSRFSRTGVDFMELRRALAAEDKRKLREDRLAELGLPPDDMFTLLRKGDLDAIQNRLAPFGERLRREDVLLADDHGETVLAFKDTWQHIGRINEALAKHGEPLGLKEYLFRYGSNSTPLDSARQAGALAKVFDPQMWKDRPEEMLELYRHAGDGAAQEVDIHAVLAETLELSKQGTAWKKAPPTLAALTKAFNCRAVPGAQVQAQFRPLGLRGAWEQMDDIRSRLRARGEKITLAELNLPGGAEDETCLTSAIRYGRLAEVLAILKESGERLGFAELTSRRKPGAETLLGLVASSGQMEELLRPANWVGRGKELQEVWKSVPHATRETIDFGAIQSEVNRLSLRQAAARRHLRP
jgi:hypothetical protein